MFEVATIAGIVLLSLLTASCAGSVKPSPSVAAGGGPPAVAPKFGWAKADTFDGTLAEVGSRLFIERGCIACHTLGGGPKVGPDLAGVTGRDGPAWVVEMMLDPGHMRQDDLHAREMEGTYRAKMANRHLTPEEARAIAEYFIGYDLGLMPHFAAPSPTLRVPAGR